MSRLGIALDIGTTNIAGFIIDLEKPKDHFCASLKNSQSSHGLDVITRLTYSSAKEGNSKLLQQSLINDINNIIFSLCKKIRVNRKRIEKIIVSANTVILHFLLREDTSGLLAYPYDSKIKDSVSTSAQDLGIISSKKTKLITMPIISPFVGADAVAGILYTNMDQLSSNKFLIDLGTNAEIVFGNKEIIYSTSAAAGPAFKSKNISLGSKMISSVAQCLRNNEIDKTGKITLENKTVSQLEVRSLQLAKAAVRSAIAMLLEKSEKTMEDVKKILIAGLFGEKINREDAIQIGLVPKVNKNLIRSIGNSSLGGAKMILQKPQLLDRAHQIAHNTKHIELSLEADYQKSFLDNINF